MKLYIRKIYYDIIKQINKMELTKKEIEQKMIEEHKKYDKSHGTFYDRGMSDCYYLRKRMPHKWKTFSNIINTIIVLASTPEEEEEYNCGYDYQEIGTVRRWTHTTEISNERTLYGRWNGNWEGRPIYNDTQYSSMYDQSMYYLNK